MSLNLASDETIYSEEFPGLYMACGEIHNFGANHTMVFTTPVAVMV